MVLVVLYWLIVILGICGYWIPEPYARYARGIDLVLFIILGIKIFGLPS